MMIFFINRRTHRGDSQGLPRRSRGETSGEQSNDD